MTIKRESTASVASKKPAKADAEYQETMNAKEDDSGDGQTTPRASQHSRFLASTQSSRSRASKSRDSEKSATQSSKSKAFGHPASQSRTAAPRTSQSRQLSQRTDSIPLGSQIIVLSSSDAELEVEAAPEDSNAHLKEFRHAYNLDSDEDNLPGSSGGWVAKKNDLIEPRAVGGGNQGLRDSSQNAKSGKNSR